MKMRMSVLVLILLVVAGTSAMAQNVQFAFHLSSAPEAAFGAPVGYFLRAANKGATTTTEQTVVTLTAPDGVTKFTLTNSSPSLAAGALSQQAKTITTSTLTSQTGLFTLTATLQVPKGGPVVAQQTATFNVLALPTSNPNPNVYASIGGWSDSAPQGAAYYYNTVTANLTSASMTLRTQVTLVNPDNTSELISSGKSTTIAAGASSVTASLSNLNTNPASVNTTQYNTQAGTFTLRVDVFDTSNNLVATNTHSFTRNASTLMPVMFMDTASMGTNTSGINVDRMMMTMTGCGNFSDFMSGGSGFAVGDINGDGFDDLFVVDMMGMIKLYQNNKNGTFADITANSGIMPMMMSGSMMGGPSAALFADFENLGRPDLLLLNGPDGMIQLFHNNGFQSSVGQVTFTEITSTSGLNGMTPQNYIGATVADYDNDGYLDLYVPVHADCMAMNQNDHLFHNNGNGTFTDMTSLLGGSTAPAVNGRGLAALFADFRQVGLVDLYVANDIGYSASSHANVYWQNNGNGTFTDKSSATNLNLKQSIMGLDISDYNNSGVFSIVESNVGTNYLMTPANGGTYRNASPGYDADVDRPLIPLTTGGTTVSRTWTPWFCDFNNDGFEDLYIAGDITKSATKANFNDASILFLNNHDGTFLDTTGMNGFMSMMMMTNTMPGTAFSDFANNGFVDIVQGGMMGPIQLLMNQGMNTGTQNWLEVKLVGQGCQTPFCGKMNTDAVGARVVATAGGTNMLRTVHNGGNYQSNSSLTLHFGLGAATQVDTLTVYWADSGKETTVMTAVPANQRIVITEP